MCPTNARGTGSFTQETSKGNHPRRPRGQKTFLIWMAEVLIWGATLVLTASVALCKIPPLYPSNILKLPPGGQAIVVDKSRQHLYLIASRRGHLMIEKHVICATGQKDGVKEKAGDRKTPEGIYFIKGLLLPPRLEPKYGICALPLNYPNLIDKRLRRDGNGIWIHGIHKDRPIKSTQGCVVLQNDDLAYLAKRVTLYTTPVVIVPATRLVPEKALLNNAKKYLSFLEHWREAWSAGKISRYISCYSPKFETKGMDLAQWRKYKAALFKRYHHHMLVEIQDPVIIHTEKYDVAVFRQEFQGGNFHAIGYKRLYLHQEGGEDKIIGEEWISSRDLDARQSFFKRRVASIRPLESEFRIVSLTPMAPAPQRVTLDPVQEAREFLKRWKTLWEKREIGPFSALYSRHFRFKSMDFHAWKRYKIETFKKNGPIHLTLQDITCQKSGGRMIVRFHQIYRSRAFQDSGEKELVLVREAGRWKIIRERWSRSR